MLWLSLENQMRYQTKHTRVTESRTQKELVVIHILNIIGVRGADKVEGSLKPFIESYQGRQK